MYETVDDDGGLPLLSYELQIGTELLNDFIEVVGGDPFTLQNYFTVTRGINKGQTYTFRYRAVNAIGAGPWSEVAELDAATVPIPPPKPVYVSSTSTSITIAFTPTLDNGGSKIIHYKLLRDAGNLQSDVNIEETDYDGFSSIYTVQSLTPGFKYRFRYIAANKFGDSASSLTLTVASSSLSDPPVDIAVDWSQSTKTSLFIHWSPPSTLPDSPILGYVLQMDDGAGGQFVTVYDGSQLPGITGFLKTGLANGGYYRFQAFALNFNGLSLPSEISGFFVCTQPTGFEAPTVTAQSSSQIALEWNPPIDAGGCRITSFAIFRSDGLTSAIDIEVNIDNDPAVREKPSLSQFLVTSFPDGGIGRTYKFQIQVFTTQRSALSKVGYFVLAGIPSKPTDVPMNDPTLTSASQIKVNFANPPPVSNGSPILSYELQMDDGVSGDFTSLVGFTSFSLLTTWTQKTLIIKGRMHRFRYRALNLVGWSHFSEEAAILAAQVPSTPARPSFISYTVNSLTILIPASLDNGGSDIIKYELWVDAGNDFNSDYHKIEGFDGLRNYYVASDADGLVVGEKYRFICRSLNIIGFSDFSTEGYISFGDVPYAPAAPTRIWSTEKQIKVTWLPPAASDLSVTGYILNVDDGRNTDLLPVYIGVNRPDVLSFTVSGLTKGLPYRFSVQAINENGHSP
jgi:hypothetical protein